MFPYMVFFFMNFFLFFSRIVFVDFFFILSWLRILLRSFFLKNTVDCYNVSPHGFCFVIVFPYMFFFKIIFVNFFFNIELVGNLALTFHTCFFPLCFLFFFCFFPKLSSSFFYFFVFFFRIVFVDFIFSY
jgi:hypothetical protein